MPRKKDSALSRESIVGPTHPPHDFPLLQPVGLVDDVTGTQAEHGGRSCAVASSGVSGEWKVYKEVYLKDVVGANNYNISMLQDHDCLNIYKAPNAD